MDRFPISIDDGEFLDRVKHRRNVAGGCPRLRRGTVNETIGVCAENSCRVLENVSHGVHWAEMSG